MQILGKNGLVEWLIFQEQLRKHHRFKNNDVLKKAYNFLYMWLRCSLCTQSQKLSQLTIHRQIWFFR